MNATDVLEVVRESIIVTLKIGGPIMIITLLIGLVISLFQALTQIQEMTLTFVPKVGHRVRRADPADAFHAVHSGDVHPPVGGPDHRNGNRLI